MHNQASCQTLVVIGVVKLSRFYVIFGCKLGSYKRLTTREVVSRTRSRKSASVLAYICSHVIQSEARLQAAKRDVSQSGVLAFSTCLHDIESEDTGG